jgi:hypothetical protein
MVSSFFNNSMKKGTGQACGVTFLPFSPFERHWRARPITFNPDFVK